MKRIILLLTFFCLLTGCKKEAPPPKTSEDPKPISVTRWTDKTELFMEYPPLVAGEKARFAVHFTDLRTFKPVATGHVVVQLVSTGGGHRGFYNRCPQPARHLRCGCVTQISRDLLHGGAVEFSGFAGPACLGLSDCLRRRCTGCELRLARRKVNPSSFSRSSSGRWNLPRRQPQERTLRQSFKVPGEIRPRTGGEAEVTAPVAGRLSSSHLPAAIGTLVTKGQVLAALIPRTANPADRASLELAVSEATTALGLARKDLDRVERLLAAGAIPPSEWKRPKDGSPRKPHGWLRPSAAWINTKQTGRQKVNQAKTPSFCCAHLSPELWRSLTPRLEPASKKANRSTRSWRWTPFMPSLMSPRAKPLVCARCQAPRSRSRVWMSQW